jgi:hypothetical protein
MTRFLRALSAVILLACIVNIGIVCAADAEETQADLNVSKMVSSAGPYETDDEVTWVVTVWNNGPGNATNITLAENSSQLSGLKTITAVAGSGEFNTTTNLWNIDELGNATSATLTLTTTFSTPGEKINIVDITAFNETDPVVSNNHAEAAVQINASDVIPPDGEETQADLTVSKVVSSAGPYETDDEVTWVVTVRNNGPGNATNITLAEDGSQLDGLKTITVAAGSGEFNTTTNLWNIDELGNATSATLTLTTTFSTQGDKTNKVAITSFSETDPVVSDNHAEATVQINASDTIPLDIPVTADLKIRPTTLNLKSKGVFTVFVTLKGILGEPLAGNPPKPRINSAGSSLTCSGAEMIRMSVSNKDGGTLIAKFHRQDLENVTAGEGVRVNCSGTLTVDGKAIDVEGSDTIRVIGEKSDIDKIFSRLLKFLGLAKDDVEITEDDDGNVTLTVSLNPDDFRNSGQMKKALIAQGKKSVSQSGDDQEVSRTTPGKENQERKEKPTKTNGNDKSVRENNADKKADKGNNDDNGRDDKSNGKSNGKKNK